MPEQAEYGKQLTYYEELTDDEILKRYQNRIEWAKNSKMFTGWHQEAAEFLTYYRNHPKVYSKGNTVVVPTAIKNVDAMFAALTAFEIWPVVSPMGDTSYLESIIEQAALRHEWEEIDVGEQTDYAIKEAVIVNLGFVKIGYEYEEEGEGEEVTGDVYDEESGEVVEATETDDSEVNVILDSVFVEHIPYDEIYWDTEAKKWDDVTWVCQKYELPIEQVKGDPLFENTDDISASSYISGKANSKEANPDEERVVLFEFWDLVRGTVTTLAEGHDKILRRTVNPFARRRTLRKRNPFAPYTPRKDVGRVIGIGEIKAMKPSLDEQNVIRTSIATYIERMKPKLLAEEGVLDDKAKKGLRSQEWGYVVELKQGAILQQSFKPLDYPTLPQESFFQDERSAQDASDAIGMNELLGAQLPVGRKTATAMQMLGTATTVRQSEKRNSLGRFYREVADKMLYLMKAYYDKPRIARIVGDTGDEAWEWSAADIQGQSKVSINIEPKEILDSDAKREKFLALLNVLGGDPTINQLNLKKWVLTEGLGIPAEVVRDILKSEDEVALDQRTAMEQELALKATGPQSPQPFNAQVTPPMEPGAFGGPPLDAVERAQTGETGAASPVL